MKDTPKVMFIGLGHAGTKVMLTAAEQFSSTHYAFAAVDVPNEVINLDMKDIGQTFSIEPEWEGKLEKSLAGLELLVLFLGLGGKTAAEAAKTAIAKAQGKNLPVMAFATLPFDFEGEQRRTAASRAVTMLRKSANALIILPNQLLFEQFPKETNAVSAFERADTWIAEVACCVLKPFTFANIINIRRENLLWLLDCKNATVSVGIGWGEGEDAVAEAVQQLSASPFLKHQTGISQADAAVVMVSMPVDANIGQLEGCLTAVKRLFLPNLKLEIGACQDETIAEGIRIVALMRFPGRAPRKQPQEASTPSAAATTTEDAPVAHATDEPSETDRQLLLPMTDIMEYKTGIFNKNEPTKYNFENLDVPTYIRQNVHIDTR